MAVVAVWPFYSQQDKSTGKFKLATCGAAKQLAFLADRMHYELGWHVRIALPVDREDEHPFGEHVTYSYYMPPNNRALQVHWNVPALNEFFSGADIALLNHEMLAIPVRRLFPKLRIVTMFNVRPDCTLYFESAKCSDLLVMQGAYAAHAIKGYYPGLRTQVTHWPLAYDEELMPHCAGGPRDIDVLFVQRCSVSNYTHHAEFLEAMGRLDGLRVVFTDITGYLRKQLPHLTYSTPETYLQTLQRSKVAVALNANWYGGLSIREAARCGCCPLVLDDPCYRELVGEHWPFCVKDLSPVSLAERILAAVANWSDPKLPTEPFANACNSSYQAGWPKVKSDLESVLRPVPELTR